MILAKGTDGIVPVQLSAAPHRPVYLVDRVSGPERRRLCEMGLVEGAGLQIVNRCARNMMVVKVGGSRLALAGGMADHVWVK
jgi:Fe2+ transport system protein FeoA